VRLTESLLHVPKALGAERMFGVPGDFALPFFRIMKNR
jgi:indolepyruvate decarboxylase